MSVGVVGFVVYRRRKIDEINDERHDNKEEIKREILEMFNNAQGGEIKTSDIFVKYQLHRSTIANYLDELEEEGEIEQVGENKGAVYRRV